MYEVTVVVSSYDRLDLLKTTLESFLKFNTKPVKKIIIFEDSAKDTMRIGILNLIKELNVPSIELCFNEKNLGFLKNYDKSMQTADTEFIFRIEDDYLFLAPGFIEKSLELMTADPNIFQVHIRLPKELEQQHRCEDTIYSTPNGLKYKKLLKAYGGPGGPGTGPWDGISSNAGLRRKSHYNLLAPYSSFAVEEAAINVAYRIFPNFYSVLLYDNMNGYCTHIGEGRSAVFRGVGGNR